MRPRIHHEMFRTLGSLLRRRPGSLKWVILVWGAILILVGGIVEASPWLIGTGTTLLGFYLGALFGAYRTWRSLR